MRQHMAKLGFRTVDEMVGRVEKIDASIADAHWKAKGIDLSSILYAPTLPSRVARRNVPGAGSRPRPGARSCAHRQGRSRRLNRRLRSRAASPSATCTAPWAPCWAARSRAATAPPDCPTAPSTSSFQRLSRPELRRLRPQRRHARTRRRRQRLSRQRAFRRAHHRLSAQDLELPAGRKHPRRQRRSLRRHQRRSLPERHRRRALRGAQLRRHRRR